MKINDKYEISPFGNPFDSLFSLISRNDESPAYFPYSYCKEQGNVRIRKEEKEVMIQFLVPGIKKADLVLSVEDQKLTLCSTQDGKKQGDGWFQNNELNYQIRLSENLDTSKINAKLDEGVLTVAIPVSQKATGRKIKIS